MNETASYADRSDHSEKDRRNSDNFQRQILEYQSSPYYRQRNCLSTILSLRRIKAEVSLYTYAPAGSTDYPVEDTVTVTVEEKGILVENPQIEWSIDKNDVAVVENGKITAVGAGTATVTAVYKDVTLSVAVTVTKTILPADKGITEYDLNADESDAEWLEFEFNAEDIAAFRDIGCQ